METIIKNAVRVGNSAGILLPKSWEGCEIKAVLIERPLNIKQDALRILEPYLPDILGIYLVGSYARREETEKSDVDVVVISKNTRKDIISGKYSISIVTLESIKRTIEKNPILVLPRLREAKVILNSSLLEELKTSKIQKSSFKEFIEDTKRIIKINGGFIKLDKEQKFEHLDSISVIYSLILRLRGIFLMKCLLKNRRYSKKEFLKWLEKEIGEIYQVYQVYENIRDNKKVEEEIKIETAEKLLQLLKKEMKNG